MFDVNLVAGALLIALAASGAAGAEPSTTTAIAGGYLLRCTALMNPTQQNQDAADALLSPGFEGTDARGLPVAREQYLSEFSQVVSRVRATGCYNTLRSVDASAPNTVVAVNTLHLDGLLRSSAGDHPVTLSETSQDTWLKAGGDWNISQSKTLKLTITIDGKVFRNEGP